MTEVDSAANAAVLRAIDEDRLSERKLFSEQTQSVGFSLADGNGMIAVDLREELFMAVAVCTVREQDWVQEIKQRNGVAVSPGREPVKKDVVDAGPWEPVIQKIVAYQHLGDDWDGFGAQAPSREILESAIGLAYCFYEDGVDPPRRVAPGVCGAVIFEWQDPNGTYTVVEIDRPLHAEVMVVEPGKPPRQWTLPTE